MNLQPDSRTQTQSTSTFKRIKDRLDELAWPAENWRKEEIAFANFNQLYCQISHFLIGRNFSRSIHRDEQPLALAALDYQGTKTNSDTIVEEKRDLHSHAFVVVAPQHQEKMESYGGSPQLFLQHADQLDCSIHIKRYEGDIHSTLSYATKYLRFGAAESSPTFPYRIYPGSFYSATLRCESRSRLKEKLLREAR